jgi:DNA-binding transcriptional ArsR family regulator
LENIRHAVSEEPLVIEDTRVLAALFDPLRYRLYGLLAAPRSVAELAREVDLPANRLYYHVHRLVESGLVRQVDARANGRHTERIFGRTATRIRFSGDVELYEGGLLRGISDELDVAMQLAGEDGPGSLSYHRPTLRPGTARELEERLRSLVAEYAEREEAGEGAAPFGVLAVLAPLGVAGGES